MTRKIRLQLNIKSVENGIKEFEEFKRDAKQKYDDACQALVDEGIKIVRSNILLCGCYRGTGRLYNSVQGYYDPTSGQGYIWVFTPNERRENFNYALVVEFGSGIMGSQASSPDRPSWYDLDRKNHGDRGWWYDSNVTGKWEFTRGQAPRPFMWNSYLEILEKAKGIARLNYRVDRSEYGARPDDPEEMLKLIGFID